MKNVLYLLLAGLLISACDNSLFNQLPPATQEGRGTFGCKVNGEVWLPTFDGAFDQKAVANVEYDTSLTLNATGKGYQVQMWVTGKIKDMDYILNNQNRPMGKYRNGESEKNFFTDRYNLGYLSISKFDTVNYIISGTFWFDAANEDGEIVEIREGRFDLKYNK